MKRAVLYLRLSVSDDASTSIQRQEADLRALAEREGWDVVRVLADDGLSGRKVRANVGEAFRMLREDEAEVLAVWKLDRLTRQGLSAIGALVDALEAAPGSLFVALQDGLRSDQAAWRLIAAVLSEVARTEADNTALRVSSAIRAGKTSGRYTGGVVPFGYRPAPATDGPGRILVPDAREAGLVQEIAERIFRGDSILSIADDLNRRKVATTRSPARRARIAGRPSDGLETGRWTTNGIQQLMTSEHLLGRVTHRGMVLADDDGLPRKVWEPILDFATATRLRDRLRNPRLPSTKPQRRRAARLLSGVAYCAHCGGKMYLNSSGTKPVYACPRRLDPACPAPRMTADLAERFVTEEFLSIVGDVPELEPVEHVSDPGTSESLAEVENALREASTALLSDDIDADALMVRISALKARRAALRAVPATVSFELQPTGRTISEAWNAAEDDTSRRTVLLSRVDHVTISRNLAAGRKGLHPERIAFHWYS